MGLRQEDCLARLQRGTKARASSGAVVAALGRDLKRQPFFGETDDVVERGDEGAPRAVAGRKDDGPVAESPARAAQGRAAGEPRVQRGGYGELVDVDSARGRALAAASTRVLVSSRSTSTS